MHSFRFSGIRFPPRILGFEKRPVQGRVSQKQSGSKSERYQLEPTHKRGRVNPLKNSRNNIPSFERPITKVGSCCGEMTIQFSDRGLRSLADFYIELEQLCCSFSAPKFVYGTSGLTMYCNNNGSSNHTKFDFSNNKWLRMGKDLEYLSAKTKIFAA